jgi:hypothetical protein
MLKTAVFAFPESFCFQKEVRGLGHRLHLKEAYEKEAIPVCTEYRFALYVKV